MEKAKTIAEKPVLGQGGILPQIFGRGAQIHIDVTNIDCKLLAKTPMDAMTVGQAVKTMELVNTGKTTMTRDELPFLRNATATLQCGPK
ncbi:MAG: hypothetical protein JWO78_1535 [Micavibrio sp.]|nr:hypothetical protein [Micavibrio sp.]